MRKPLLILLLGLGLALPAPGLGTLVQPDGTVVALGETAEGGGLTLLFPAQAVASRSWVALPQGSSLVQAVLRSKAGREVFSFPAVPVPGVRYALEVPAQLLSLTLYGRVPGSPTLVRTSERPGTPGQAWVARSARTLAVDLPPWTVPEGASPLVTLTRPGASPWRIKVSGTGLSRTFTPSPQVLSWDFAPPAWGFLPGRIEVSGADPRLDRVQVRAVPGRSALPADPPTILAWPPSAWRDPRREWFSWAGTSVLVLLSADYRVQDAYLKRLAFFVEKEGFRGRLTTDEETQGLHGWNAHDYAAPDLARFFTLAAAEDFPLHPEELELRDRLVASGILTAPAAGTWAPGTGALIAVSAATAPALRAVLFTHEAFHGLYYTGPEFRAGVQAVWNALSPGAQQAFRTYLARSDYDPTSESLMVNEFQAYVLQRPAAEWPGFFRERVLGGAGAPDWMAEYLEAARALDQLVGRLYGMRSGDVALVSVT